MPWRASSASHAGSEPPTRGRCGPGRAARCAARAPARRRARVAARAGHIAATTWSRCARRSAGGALHELEAVGQEDGDERAGWTSDALDRRAVDLHPLRLARLEADRELVRAVVVATSTSTRAAVRVEAHDLALVGRPARARRCSRSTAPRGGSSCRRRCVRGRRSGPGPSATSARRSCGSRAAAAASTRHRRPSTFRRIGMIRYRKPLPSPASIRPGRSGLMSFRTRSPASTLSRPSRRKSGLKPISNGSPGNGTGSGSLASPTSGVCAETVSSPSLKRSRSGAFFCAMRLMRAHDVRELLAGDASARARRRRAAAGGSSGTDHR